MENVKMEPKKITYGVEDIKERYGVGTNKARAIMQEIRALTSTPPAGSVSAKGALGSKKVLWSEVLRWERKFLGEGAV